MARQVLAGLGSREGRDSIMASFDFDLVVIGGGPAGEKGAAQAAYFGVKTALVEKELELGGACINTGTLASKTLRETSLFLSGARRGNSDMASRPT